PEDNGGSNTPEDNGGSNTPEDNGGSNTPEDNGGSNTPEDNGGSNTPEDNGGLEFNQKGERLVSPENDHTIDNRDKETSVNDKDRNFKSKSGSMKNSKSTLPETGNESAPTTLVGMLFAAIGSLFLFRRKRQKRD
ncbi:LPXTG cell wall anchor domain-containing protein, partial [Staphylococcus agnetis]